MHEKLRSRVKLIQKRTLEIFKIMLHRRAYTTANFNDAIYTRESDKC